ncbi:hypothetical protein [Lebetimonas sp. JS032]|uniref:hypothetical protein n=1 Tax=Lebetimonas sp. JS032 TaxID=990070 RepID=UPI000466FBD4|nr:hypothetical protein [Lebetimonas sp. JS032]
MKNELCSSGRLKSGYDGKWKIILLLPLILNAFNVKFIKIEKKFIIPNEDAVLIQTKENLIFPFKFYRTKNGYIIKDTREIENYLNNKFYAPKDAKFKYIKIAVVDMDQFQYQIIKKLSNIYKSCKIKNIIFLNPDEEKIVLKPTEIKLRYKITLDCK